jgi:hypothetical protein
MATSLDQVAATLREAFPVREGLYAYELANTEQPVRADGVITVRMIVWELGADGTQMIRDIKEQELFVFDPALLTGDVPVLELLRGWADAVREVFRNPKPDVIETLMPHDLAPGDAIRLRKPTTAAEYRDAILAKSRLGQFLAPRSP